MIKPYLDDFAAGLALLILLYLVFLLGYAMA